MKRKVIAVTGGIGSGKSEVCRLLRELGHTTVDCDALARQISTDSQVVAEVGKLLGADFVSDGSINRAMIRQTVFTDANLTKKYNEIFHGRVRQRLDGLLANTSGTVFVEIAVIDAFEYKFDEIWLVECPSKIRIDRVTKRDGVSAENVEHIMLRQHYNKFDRVLRNDSSLEDLRVQVLSALKNAQIV